MHKPPDQAKIAAGWLVMQKSRAHIQKMYPHFYRTLLGLIPQHVPDINTLYVTKRMKMGIDMEWFSTITPSMGAGCLIHEVMHVLRDLTRIEAMANPKLAGYAFDMPINDDLKRCGIELPPWVVYSSSHGFQEGLTGEAYYHLLLKEGIEPPTPKLGCGGCGSCSGGKDPLDIDSEGQDGGIPGRSEAEVAYFKKVGANDLREFVKGKLGGKAPGSWKEILEFKDEVAVVPWQSILPATLGECFGKIARGGSDYSLRRPSRRSYSVGFLRPSLISYMPNVIFVEDSSGSMGHVQLKENRVEFVSIMKMLGLSEVWFFNIDTKVQKEPKKININDLYTMPVLGRGGTQFMPAIEKILQLRPRAELAVFSTDGGCFDTISVNEAKIPSWLQFVWLLAPGPWTTVPCKWGKRVLTTNDKDERKRYEIVV